MRPGVTEAGFVGEELVAQKLSGKADGVMVGKRGLKDAYVLPLDIIHFVNNSF